MNHFQFSFGILNQLDAEECNISDEDLSEGDTSLQNVSQNTLKTNMESNAFLKFEYGNKLMNIRKFKNYQCKDEEKKILSKSECTNSKKFDFENYIQSNFLSIDQENNKNMNMRLRSNSAKKPEQKERILLKDEIRMLLRELINRTSNSSNKVQIENQEKKIDDVNYNSNELITLRDVECANNHLNDFTFTKI